MKLMKRKLQEINNHNIDGKAPIHLAVEANQLNLIQQLIKMGADINLQMLKKRRSGFKYCRDTSSQAGSTALHIAVQDSNLAIVKMLIKSGANIDQADESNATALYRTLTNPPYNRDCVNMLLRNGANPNITRHESWSLLPIAVAQGNTYLVKILLQAKADPNISCSRTTRQDRRPIHLAAANGNSAILQCLINAGADVNAMNPNYSPLHFCVQNNHVDCVKILLDSGANIDLLLKDSCSLLHFAVDYSKLQVIKLLVEHGQKIRSDIVNVNFRCSGGKTALMNAVVLGRYNVIQYLIHAGSDANAPDYQFRNAVSLRKAKQINCSNSFEIDQLLLPKSDFDMPDVFGKTLMHYVCFL